MTPKEVLAELERVRADTIRRFYQLNQKQLDVRPPATKEGQPWSLGEIFMHVAIDEIYLRELIARPLREGSKPPDEITYLPPPPPYGVSKNEIQFWLDRARSQTMAFVEDWPADWHPDLKHAGGLEPMNALEWLEGYGSHEAFHHRQMDAGILWCRETGVS